MALNNPVIVTALFDIGRETWNNYTMSYHTYCWWARNTLSLDSNIVVYTEEKFLTELKNYRREFDPNLEKTIFITKKITELDCYTIYYEKLKTLMESEKFINKISFKNVPEMCQPLYNIIMFNKVFFLKDTIDNKYFNNDVVIWADAGGLRDDINVYKNTTWPKITKLNLLDKNVVTVFSHNLDVNITDFEYHALSQIRNIQGTCFFVPSHLIDILITVLNQTINDAINNSYIGSDEKIFDICYTKHKSLFNLIKSNWREYFNYFK
jgi:hypothetical protein